MNDSLGVDRRDFLRLGGFGGVVFASALPGCAHFGSSDSGQQDFSFVQLSDIHWGYNNPKVNPEPRNSLTGAIAAVNALEQQPDFIAFTGDLTQGTDDPRLRRQRLREFKEIASGLKNPNVRFYHGEHVAALDRAEAFLEVFGGELYSSFEHKGVHFIVLDNTSLPASVLGAPQLDWLQRDLSNLAPNAPIVVLTHRPLFPMHPQWDWATRDGDKAIKLLSTHDRPYWPPCCDVHDVPAFTGRRRATKNSIALGYHCALQGTRLVQGPGSLNRCTVHRIAAQAPLK